MFSPKTERIKKLTDSFPKIISELENIFDSTTNIYLDWANIIHWQDRLGWHIHPKRLKQFFDSFDFINNIKLYIGTLEDNQKSKESVKEMENMGYDVYTKPVKIMKLNINMNGIPKNSPILLENFIRDSLLSKLSLETIEFLNNKFIEFNKQGITYIEDKKCNFDVEIGRHMLRDFDKNNINNFILWSGDSDFVDPINQLVNDNKKVFIFATAREVSFELNKIKVPIFDIKKIREFICWPKEIPQDIKDKISSI